MSGRLRQLPDDSAFARGGDGVVYLGGELPCLADGVGGVELAGQDQAPILAASELVQARKDLRHVLAQRFDVAIVLVELARHPDQPDGESGVGFVALSIAPHVQENWPVSIGHERFHFSRGEAQPGPACSTSSCCGRVLRSPTRTDAMPRDWTRWSHNWRFCWMNSSSSPVWSPNVVGVHSVGWTFLQADRFDDGFMLEASSAASSLTCRLDSATQSASGNTP